MASIIKLFGDTKIYDKFVLQIVPPIDSILLEDESGSMIQEMDGQIALEIQEN
jgi:hypothetical protein